MGLIYRMCLGNVIGLILGEKLSSNTKYDGKLTELISHSKGMKVKLRTNGILCLSSMKPESNVRERWILNLKLGYRNTSKIKLRALKL